MAPKSFKVVSLPRCHRMYPDDDVLFAVSEDSKNCWSRFFTKTPKADKRENNGMYRDIRVLDAARFKYNVSPGENVVFLEEGKGELVAVVISQLFQEPELVETVNNAVMDHINKTRKTSRADDPGMLAQVGFTSGCLSASSLGWAANLKKSAAANKTSHEYRMSCIFAHVWNNILGALPQKYRDIIAADYKDGAKQFGGFEMDGGLLGGGDGTLEYQLKVGGQMQKFKLDVLAPASGNTACNYCRYTHAETNLNKFCVTYCSERTHGEETGGNFYSARYKINIPNRANQVIIWRGADHHGTTLPVIDPEDEHPTWRTAGLGYILSKRLKAASENLMKQPGKLGQFQKEALAKIPNDPVNLEQSKILPDMIKNLGKRTAKTTMATGEASSTTQEKASQKLKKPRKLLPAQHKYSDARLWTIKKLLEEIELRVGRGRPIKYRTWWDRGELIIVLLEDDGEELEDEPGLKVKRRKIDKPSIALESFKRRTNVGQKKTSFERSSYGTPTDMTYNFGRLGRGLSCWQSLNSTMLGLKTAIDHGIGLR